MVCAVAYLILVQRKTVAPYVATPKEDYETVFEKLELKSGDKFIELGCGKGNFLFYLAREHGFYGEGIELGVFLYLIARIRSRFFYGDKVKIHYGNLFKIDLSSYNKIYLYLMKHSYPSLKLKLAELKRGSRVVVAGWDLNSKSAEHKIPPKGEGRFYVYNF
jgi:SAM-dependent methyltransferase